MKWDPYEQLGVSREAAPDEIKVAYQRQAAKYRFSVDPEAQAWMKRLNEAYERLCPYRDESGGWEWTGRMEYDAYDGAWQWPAVHNYVENGYHREALQVLATMPTRNARWYYWSAIAHAGIGNALRAIQYAEMAVRMEPGNATHQTLLDHLRYGSAAYQNYGRRCVLPSPDGPWARQHQSRLIRWFCGRTSH